jgi:hypothetical protein
MKRSMDELEQVGGSLKLEKWKGGSIRNEASANLGSIQKDVQGTLPSLLKDADATPQSISALLPVSRNVDALYDVLLRVVDGARVAGPGDQVTQLQQVLADLEKGRHALDDRLVDLAAGQEKRVGDLQVAIKSQPAPVCPVVAPPPPPPPAKKKVVKKKPAAPAKNPSSTGTTAPAAPAAKPN